MTCLTVCHYVNHMRFIADKHVKTSLIKPFPKHVLPLALWITVLAGCGTESHEGLMISAKGFIAKSDCAAASIQLKNALQKRDNPEARYLLAKCAMAAGQYAQALPELRKAMDAGYAPDLVLPDFAQTLLETGDFKRLIADLADANVSDPAANAAIKTSLGNAYLALNETEPARQAFAAALTSMPGQPQARLGQARIIAAEGDVSGALQIADEVLTRQPNQTQALWLKADLLMLQAKNAAAAEILQGLIRTAPLDGRARFALTSLFIASGKLPEADAEILAMQKALPNDIRWRYLQAWLALQNGQPIKARESAGHVLGTQPDHVPSLLLAAAAEYQLDAFAAAEDLLRKALGKQPGNLHARKLLAATYLRQNKPLQADEALGPALQASTVNPAMFRIAGEVALANGRTADASRFYDQALALEKQNPDLLTRLAQIRLIKGEADRAIEDLDATSRLDPTQYQADLAIIAAYLGRKQYEQALAAAARLEDKQSSNPLTHNVKAAIYLGMRDAVSARASFERALVLRPDYLPAASSLARMDLADKNPAAAKARFESVLAIAPANVDAILGLAQAQMSAGAAGGEIAATIERAVRVNPKSASARLALLDFLVRKRDFKNAVISAKAAVAAIPDDARLIEALGQAQVASGEAFAAIETFRSLVALQAQTAEPLRLLAMAQSAARQYLAAMQSLRKAQAIKPDFLEVHRDLVAVALQAGQPDEALAEARAVQQARPKDALGFGLEGEVHENQKRFSEASRSYAEALRRQAIPALAVKHFEALTLAGMTAEANAFAKIWLRDNPKDSALRFVIAERALQEGRYADAANHYRALVDMLPEDTKALNNLAWALAELKAPGALAYAEKAYSLDPNDPNIQDTYGWQLLGAGKTERAVQLLKRASAGAPQSADIRFHLAQGLLKAGDKAGAKTELQAALKLPASAAIKSAATSLLETL